MAQTCFGLKPIQLPPLGHPNASQTCVCESTNRCHWAWVDLTNQTQSTTPGPSVNLFDEMLRKSFESKLREKELRQQQEFVEQQQQEAETLQREVEARQDARLKSQNDQTGDLAILKAVHEGILVQVTPEDPAICNLERTATLRDQCRAKLAAQFAAEGPTISNSSGQLFRVVAPASDHATPSVLAPASTNTDQYFTKGLLNGRMWVEMSVPDRVFYVSAFLQGYAVSCFYGNDDGDQQRLCFGRLGDPAHINPVNPREIVEGVNNIFADPLNRSLIIPVAIKAASMIASGASSDAVDKYLQSERDQIAH